MGVYLDGDIVLRAGPEYLLDIDFVTRPALELPPRHVTDDRRVSVGDRLQQAFRLGLSVELEPPVDARHSEIEAGEHVVGIVEGAISKNIGLDALQDPEVLPEFPVDPIDFAMLLLDPLDRQPTGVVGGLGMIGDAEILETALARGLGHRFQGLGAIGRVGMAVQDSAQVLVGHEPRQLPFQGSLDFAAPLAQFRLDEGQPESAVNVLLLGGNRAAALVQSVLFEAHPFVGCQSPKFVEMRGDPVANSRAAPKRLRSVR